jgi:hypothetical protein
MKLYYMMTIPQKSAEEVVTSSVLKYDREQCHTLSNDPANWNNEKEKNLTAAT